MFRNITTRIIGVVAVLMLSLCLGTSALADGQAGTVTGNLVNMRRGPGTQYARVQYLNKGDTVTVTDQNGSWYAVTVNGTDGYVYSNYVSVSAAAGTPAAPAASSSATLRRGSTGSAVKTLQGNLIMLGYLSDTADGQFGAKTEAAVRRYQSKNHLGADGIAGAKTRAAIAKEVLTVNKVIDTAKSYLGTAYVYGGSSPSTGFDCSGLTQYAFSRAGISIPRVSREQAAHGVSVPRSQLRISDLVAFNSPVTHVGIYVGNGRFIHSPKTGDVVKLTKLSAMNLTAIRRFTGVLAG